MKGEGMGDGGWGGEGRGMKLFILDPSSFILYPLSFPFPFHSSS
jgi:hypothetical protein